MPRPCKSKVADKAGSTNAAKANPPPSQRTRLPDKKPNKNKDEKIQEGQKNPEAAADRANATTKNGSYHPSTGNSYNVAFRKVMTKWMSVNFPDEVSSRTASSQLGKGNAGEQAPEPSLAQWIGWLDSQKDRNETKANDTLTTRYWQKFCEQTQNKKTVNSWMEFASNVRTADGLKQFQPAFDYVGFGTSPDRRVYLHPLISFPSAGQYREKEKAALGRQVDSDDGIDRSEEDESAIEPPTAAANKEESAAPKKRSRQCTKGTPAGATKQTATDEDDADSSDRPSAKSAKRPRTKKTARPSTPRSREASAGSSNISGHFDPEVEKRMWEGMETKSDPMKKDHTGVFTMKHWRYLG